VSVCSGIALLVGLGLGVAGAAVLATALARDPATDFSHIGVCKIDNTSVTRKTVKKEYETEKKKLYKCNDEYVYTFCLPNSNTSCYDSKTDTKQACGARRCEECSSDTTPTFEYGEETQCWEAAPEYTPGFPYVCGNTPCYKIFDPAGEATAAIVLGAVLLPVGVVISSIVAAVFAWCCCTWKKEALRQEALWRRSSALRQEALRQPAATQYASPGGGMPVVAAMPVAAAQPVQPVVMAIAMPVAAAK
jgi:hypothetical protein